MIFFKQLLGVKAVVLFLCCIPIYTKAQLDKSTISNNNDTLKTYPLIYYSIPQDNSVSSVAILSGNKIAHTPVASYPLALSGTLTGLRVNQTNGQPLNEEISIALRGRSPMILIDGIPRSVTEIGMQEIESITVLKDAVSLGMLGIRGAGGAISIVTKKGSATKSEINFSGQWGTQYMLQNLIGEPLGAYQYALLYNEALTNDGLSVQNRGFNETTLAGYRNRTDDLIYPDVNWRDELLKDQAAIARYNLNTRGGNNFVRYFVNLEHLRQDGFLKTDNANNYSTNTGAKGYFIRSNVDLKLSDKLEAGIYLQGRLMQGNSPGNDAAPAIFQSILNTPNNAYPIYNANGTYAGNALFQNNILAQAMGSGYSIANTRTVLTDFYLKGNMDHLIAGLWVKARASFFSNLRENYIRNKSFAVFQWVNNDPNNAYYKQYGNTTEQNNSNNIAFQNRSNFQELSIGYSKTTNKHEIQAVALVNRDNLVNGSNLAYTVQGLAGHLAYNFDSRYLAEVSFAVNGANRYPNDGGFRYGTFPALGLGWNIHKETFLKDTPWLNALKLYGSFGAVGRDNASYYTYLQSYNAAPTTYFGSSATIPATIGESYLAYPDVTWEKVTMLNIGLDARFFQNRLTISMNHYTNKHTDLSIVRGTNSETFGINYPAENIGKQQYSGFEGELGWQETKQKIGYYAFFNASIQQSKLIYAGEPTPAYEWMVKTGNPVGQAYGYIAEGLFRDEGELLSHPTIEGYQAQLGDIKYRDLNNDSVINQYDQSPIGSTKPEILIGTRLGLQVGAFDFNAFLQGELNRQVYLSGNSYREFANGTGQAYSFHLDRWTPENISASYPRLSTNSGPRNGEINNNVTSTFWLQNGNFLRLRTIELGYALPQSLLRKAKLQTARLFVHGYNLFTIGSKTFRDADPENFKGLYPIQKTVSLGVHIQL
ncbi:SusC/RagA family TonB-linked outer membrane protein [Sphingobacterium sp. LRF_L2]|uniref:SusC/RagA family TonB-linked outer membrane protein n=1 Tax=Sphingobacterium sp. LRF_L2 TaxID=3369421 RepID=UPI003F5E2A8F